MKCSVQRLAFIALIFSFAPLQVVFAETEAECLVKALQSAQRSIGKSDAHWPAHAFDPISLLHAKGLTASDMYLDFYRKKTSSPYSTMIVSYRNAPILRTHFWVDRVGKMVIPATGELPIKHSDHGPMRGKGIGTLGYMVAARTLFKQGEFVLRSDIISDDPLEGMSSEDAQKVWARLKKGGWARQSPCILGTCIEFRKEVLASDFFRHVGQFCQTQCRYHDNDPRCRNKRETLFVMTGKWNGACKFYKLMIFHKSSALGPSKKEVR